MSTHSWLGNVFRPLVVGAMIGAIVVSLGQLLHGMVPGLDVSGLVVASTLAAVEAYYSHRYVATQRWDIGGHIRYRGSELLVLFLVVRVGLLVGRGADLLSNLPHLDAPTAYAFLIVVLSWLAGGGIATDLDRIGEPVEAGGMYVAPLDSLTGRFFSGGALLLVFTGLARIEVAQLVNFARPPVPGLVLNALAYFLLGVLLLGQARFTALELRWADQGVQVGGSLVASWVRYSLAFAALVAILAFVLPTEYTFGFLETLGILLNAIAGVIVFLVFLLLGLVTLVISWFGGPRSAQPAQPPPLPPALPVGPRGPALDTPWLDVAKSTLFWLLIVVVAIYIVHGYLGQHPRVLGALRGFAPVRLLRRWGAGLWHWLRGYGIAAGAGVRRTLAAARLRTPVLPDRSAARRPLGRTPRDQIYRSYLDVLQRAGRTGFPRRPAQTPQEYRATLAPALPQADPDLAGLTQAFTEARYSRHPIAPAQADQAYRQGQQVEAALDALAGPPTAPPVVPQPPLS